MSARFRQGDVISYIEMCSAIGVNLQRGMNFRLRDAGSVILMSLRPGAPYEDQVNDEGKLLIYEGHDCSKTSACPFPKKVDQPESYKGGSRTQNGLFIDAVNNFKTTGRGPEKVSVFDKVRNGIWVYNGVFELVDYGADYSSGRRVFKFHLQLAHAEGLFDGERLPVAEQDDDRIIPSWVKLEVWKRDQGKCRICGANSHLHFDHILPYSKGGSSKDPVNIQILCLRHNLQKRDKIE
jgi:hypothetical protein